MSSYSPHAHVQTLAQFEKTLNAGAREKDIVDYGNQVQVQLQQRDSLHKAMQMRLDALMRPSK